MRWFLIRYIIIGQRGTVRTAMQKARSAMAASGRFINNSGANIIVLSSEEMK